MTKLTGASIVQGFADPSPTAPRGLGQRIRFDPDGYRIELIEMDPATE